MQISKDLYDAKEAIDRGDFSGALAQCSEAVTLTREIADKRAERAVLRVRVRPSL